LGSMILALLLLADISENFHRRTRRFSQT